MYALRCSNGRIVLRNRIGKPELGLIILVFAVILSDQLSKWLILGSFTHHESSVLIPGFFNLTLVMNTGAAFGLFAGELSTGRLLFFAGINLAALTVLFIAFRQLKNQGSIYIIAIGLISGGALGNLTDRLRFGAVIDFLDFYIGRYHWPAFNVADSAICIGVGLFLIGNFFTNPP